MIRILLIEDNPIDARLMQRFLGASPDWPSQTTWIDDGEKALLYLKSLEMGGVDYPPEVVLLDLNLPKYNGLEVLQAFRGSIAAKDIPVFMLSSTPAEEVAALAESLFLQADAYFEKPIGVVAFEQLTGRIREFTDRNSSAARTVAA